MASVIELAQGYTYATVEALYAVVPQLATLPLQAYIDSVYK